MTKNIKKWPKNAKNPIKSYKIRGQNGSVIGFTHKVCLRFWAQAHFESPGLSDRTERIWSTPVLLFLSRTKRGSNRAQKFRRFLGFSWFFNVILMPKWGFNYSKMAKYRFLTDSNTFLTISGTSKILSKYGPVTLPMTFNLL